MTAEALSANGMDSRVGQISHDEAADDEWSSTSQRPIPGTSFPDELKDVGILEVLGSDPRPSFIIDLEELKVNGWRPTYTNGACLSALSDALVLREDGAAGPFRTWAGDTSESRTPQYRHNGKIWISYDLRSRWRIVSGTRLECPTEADYSQESPLSGDDGTESTPSSWQHVSRGSAFQPAHGVEEPDWVDLLPDTPYVNDFFKKNDWSKTSLGSLANWPYVLRRSTRFVLADPAASCLFWGDQYSCIFNAGYAEVMGKFRRHKGLGLPCSVLWPDVHERLVTYFHEVRSTRQACCWDSIHFMIERNGMLNETYWDWKLIPLMEERGVSTGFYSVIHETTKPYLTNRRHDTLLSPIHVRDTLSYWAAIHKNFLKNPWDAPFAAFYDVRHPRRLSQDSNPDETVFRCWLRASIGVPSGHPSFPSSADLTTGGMGVIPYLSKAAFLREPIVLHADTHPEFFELLKGIEWTGFGSASTTVIVLSLRFADEVLGFAIIGLNPRRPFDEDEQRLITNLDTQLSSSLSTAAMIERSHDKEVRLKERLAQSLEQTEMSDARYRAITELNPLGMVNVSAEGNILYANKTWFEITGHQPEADYSRVSFRNVVYEEDLPIIDDEFEKMVDGKKKRYYEVRLNKMKFYPEIHLWKYRWILCTGGPEYDDKGNVRSIIGCVTDITAQKHAEDIQSRHRQIAEEGKAAQEKFMDATSHEMRNPLSAILQSAEDISTSLKEASIHSSEEVTLPKHALDACVDAANIISLCAQHQTRIVDDVLTMSKLDSHMLAVSPVPAQPLKIVHETMHMYKGEFTSSQIETEVTVEPAYEKCETDWVYCDPARLKQILINLISNAIKFTRQEEKRRVTVNLTASVTKPPGFVADVKWFPSQNSDGSARHDLTQDSAWGDGEAVYVGVVVSDTGKGLSDEERNKIFLRFSQGNALTHVHYGGSGLGLFISRELTEMHGGEIGVAVQSGAGSAFAFYIKTRRAAPSRPELPLRTVSGQKVAQVAGIVAGSSPRIRPANGMAPTMPTHMEIVAPLPPNAGKDKKNFFILVVEDNIVNQRVMTKQLVKAGCTVAIANHGQEALDYLEKTVLWSANAGAGEAIDIALVDIEMPVMNGLVCARRIRDNQQTGAMTRHLPLMAVTANARKEQMDDCFAAGMDDVTTKPFRVQDLLVKVERLIEAWRSKA